KYISCQKAKKISGMTENEFVRLKNLVFLLSLRLKGIFEGCEVELWDGKFEFAFSANTDQNGDRFFTLVDSIGPDELRLIYKDVQLSKETLRKYYRDSPWYEAVEKSKALAEGRGKSDWKKVCIEELKMHPPELETQLKNAVTQMYLALTNILYEKYLGEAVFRDAWALDKLVSVIKGPK
ncbi:MAG: hypothetical protein HOM21_08515, partial [Halobacteriovoraceae bacterium]|nr:hypothetical protein [Halobacteriovoraceae bacterium]